MPPETNSERLRAAHRGLWERASDHAFIDELGDGTLSKHRFRRYFLQDYLFLDELRRVAALAVAKAPGQEEARRFDEFLGVLLGAEDSLFRRAFAELGVTEAEYRCAEPLPTTVAFGNFLVRLAYEGTFAAICSALYAAEGVYLDWASRLSRTGAAPGVPIYREWIEIHDEGALGPFVAFLAETLDGQPEDTLSSLGRHFEQALWCEAAFWEMAYRGESWP